MRRLCKRLAKLLCKCLAILLLVLVIILLLCLLSSYLLLGTDKGFRLSIEQIEKRVDGLEIGKVEGNLNEGIQTDRIDFKSDTVAINAEGLDSRWRRECLFNKEVCIDQIIIDKLRIETFDTGEEPKAISSEKIELPNIELPVAFTANDVLIKELEFQAPGDAPLQSLENIKLSAHTTGNSLNIDELSTRYENIGIHASGEITPTDDFPLDFNIKIEAQDFFEEYDISTNIVLSNSLENLNVDIKTEGAAQLRLRGQVQPLQRKLPAALTLNANQTGWPLDTMQVAKAENLELTIDGDMDDYSFTVKTALSGEQVPPTQLDLKGMANTSRALLNDITTVTLNGFVTGQAAVSWTNGVIWVAELIAKDINPGVQFEGVDAKLNGLILASGDLVDGKWTLDLSKASVDGVLRDVPFQLDSKLQKNADDTWLLESLMLDNGRNQVNATGSLTDQLYVKADIDLPELQNLLPELNGGFSADLAVQGDIKNPAIQLDAKSASIKYQEISVSGLTLSADVKKGALGESELALNVAKVESGEQALINTRFKIDGTREKHTVSLFADGPQKTSIDLLASGGLSDTFDWAGELSKVTLEVPAHEVVLRNKTDLAWNNDTKKFSVEPHCWGIQEASLCLKNQVLAEESGKAIVELDSYGLKQLNPFLPADSELLGELNTELTVDWGSEIEGGYQANMDVDITDGAISVKDNNGLPLKFDYETLMLKTKVDAKTLKSTLTVDSETMGDALLDLTMDVASEGKDITGEVDLSGFQLDFIKAFLPNYDTLSGVLSTKGNLSGKLVDPLYNGDVIISDLEVRSDDLPIAVDSGEIKAAINGKRARIDGRLESGDGNVTIDGTANLLNDSYRADLNVRTETLKIVQAPLTDSTVNGKLTLALSPERVRIRGRIDIPDAEIDIKDLPRGVATVSDDVIVVEDIYAATLAKREEKATSNVIDLQVSVALGDDVNLSGYGLTANLTGDIAVSQVSPNPVQLGGEVRIVEGIFKQYGQDLKITDGQLLFVGPVDQTSLNMQAVREIIDSDGTDRVAGLSIQGRVAAPEITLFTEPADKTQESILSYVVLGRDIRSATSEESSLLVAAAVALAVKGGQGYTEKFADTLGVNEISLDAQGTGVNTEVVVSSQVNDRLLLRYGRSVFEETDTLYLRYELTRQLFLEAAQGTDRAVDLFYEFAF